MGKLIVIAAPSGAGKTTIVHHLLKTYTNLAFSVSATTREKRHNEEEGRDYYFKTADEFRDLIRQSAFLEWEEVYRGQFYGTLKSEVERLWAAGKCVVFDIDVRGALNIKKEYPQEALTIFISPPSVEELFKRLKNRKSESAESLQKRMDKTAYELQFKNLFDVVIVNDSLKKALKTAEELVSNWLAE